MSFIPNNPETRVVPNTDTKPEPHNEFHIHELSFLLEPRNPMLTKCRIVWSEGYDNADGYYVGSLIHEDHLEGTALVAALIALVTSGNTRYDEVKGAIWQLLIDEGIVPQGSVA